MRNGKLEHFTVKGFRSIRSLEKVGLGSVNVLVGSNGSGKSNIVEVFAFLNALRHGRLVEYTDTHGLADSILHFGSRETQEIELEISFAGGVNGYHVCLGPTDEDRFRIYNEWCWFWDKEKHSKPYEQSLHPGPHEPGISRQQVKIAKYVQDHLDSWRIYHFHDTGDRSPMKKTADVGDNRFFRPDGSNLAAYLYFLQDHHKTAYQLILKTVQRVTPFLQDFALEPLRANASKIRLAWSHKSTDRLFDVSSLSDGTLRFLCLATLLLQPVELRPSMILVDEPELGLHPYALTMLATMLKAAARETQVLVSTQSPLLLDHFEPQDVLVVERQSGATTLSRLESEELQEWLQEYSLGQLWEKNQLGGRPGRE